MEGEANNHEGEISGTVNIYTFDDGDYHVDYVISRVRQTMPEYGDLVEHLFIRAQDYDDLPHDPAARFNQLMKEAADRMGGDCGAMAAGIVAGDQVLGFLGGDMRHLTNLLNLLSRQHRKDWLKAELDKLEEKG